MLRRKRQRAERRNRNSGLHSFGVIAVEHWKMAIFTTHSCPLCYFKTVWDIFMKLHTNVKHNRRHEEHRNRNSELHTFGEHWKLPFLPYTLYNIKTVWDFFMKLHTNVKHHKKMCKTQEPWLWIAYFWSYCPLNITPFETLSWNFTQMLRGMRWRAERRNRNSGLHSFAYKC